jgi:hypothetical protein
MNFDGAKLPRFLGFPATGPRPENSDFPPTSPHHRSVIPTGVRASGRSGGICPENSVDATVLGPFSELSSLNVVKDPRLHFHSFGWNTFHVRLRLLLIALAAPFSSFRMRVQPHAPTALKIPSSAGLLTGRSAGILTPRFLG